MLTSPENRSAGLSRRGLLAAGAAAGGVAFLATGCDVKNPLDDSRTPAAEATRTLSPDVAVAVEATTLIHGMLDAVAATTRAFPGLTPAVAGLDAMHTTHLAAVADAAPDRVDTTGTGPEYVVPSDRDAARARLVAAERTHHDQLTGLALRAESGRFAGLLGRMAASVSQHLAVLG
jgi:hypothetical protein